MITLPEKAFSQDIEKLRTQLDVDLERGLEE